jgi:hypothetical protein
VLIAKILGHVQQREAPNDPLARAPPGHQEQTFNLIRCPVGGRPRGGFGYDAGMESSRVVGSACGCLGGEDSGGWGDAWVHLGPEKGS